MAKDHDQPIPPEAGPADEKMTCLAFVEEARSQRLADAEFYRRASLQEQICLGEVLACRPEDLALGDQVPLYALPDEMHENAILPAVETMVARASQGRIDSKAWPRTPSSARIAAAEGANIFLGHERAREQRDQKVHELLLFALLHGRSGVYTTWDRSIGPFDGLQQVIGEDGFPVFDDGGMPVFDLVEDYGAIRTEVLSCFDFWTSGEDTPDQERWQIRRRLVDKWTAKRVLNAAGIDRDPTPIQINDFGVPSTRNRAAGVEVLEVWIKPCAMVERGTFIQVVDNCVTAVESAYPYKHQRLPITQLTCMRVRGTPHGHTKIKDAIFQQRLLDQSLRATLRLAEVAESAYLIGDTEIVDGIEEARDGRVRYQGQRPVRDAAGWVIGAEGATAGMQAMASIYSMAKQGINDVLGVSAQSVTGGDPGSTSSGEQLKTMSALDAQKDVPLRRRTEMVMERVDKQKLELAQQFLERRRLVSIIGDPVRAGYFSGADFDGVDVALEQSSGLAESHLGQSRAAEEGAAAGYVSPQDAGEMRQTGLAESVMSADARARVQKQGLDALRGAPQMPIAGVPPDAAIRELRNVFAQVRQGSTQLLLRLIAEYEQAKTSMQAAPEDPGKPKAQVTNSTKEAIKAMEPIQ